MFADGALGWTYPGTDVLVMRVGNRTLPREQGELRPGSDVVGWVQSCCCGWQDRPWNRASEPAQQDVAARRVYSPDASPPTDAIGDEPGARWFEHQAHGVRSVHRTQLQAG